MTTKSKQGITPGPWEVRAWGAAGGPSRSAVVTVEIRTTADTVEEVRAKVDALPDLIAAMEKITEWACECNDPDEAWGESGTIV